MPIKRISPYAALAMLLAAAPAPAGATGARIFRAGAYAMDVTPPKFPSIINGMFLERLAEKATDRIHARCLVLDDGVTRIAVAVVDSCMMPRELLDRAKELASQKTGIPAHRMLISATHTHSAPAAMGVLGTQPDENYSGFLPGRIAEGIERAAQNLAPAKIGWAAVDDYVHTHCRRWIYQPDKMLTDPFGARSVRANMHPGYQNPDAIGPSGPVDPGLSVLSLLSPGGRPIAVLANYSMHYFGSAPVSADYYGLFAEKIGKRIGADENFVAMMSQGTSGDQMWMDYGKPKSDLTLDAYAEGVTQYAEEAYKKIEYRNWAPLEMREVMLSLRRRTPDEQRLAWARKITARMHGQKPKNQQEVYALEQIYLQEQPVRELKLQAIRIGDLGITAIPDEVFAITGLKLKARSPFPMTFNIELANGAEGYIPPPEQHQLGGYTTWPARTAALEVEAEPKIVETVLGLLEKVSGRPRRKMLEISGPYAKAVLDSKPLAYWRLNEAVGPQANDATGHHHEALYEDGVVFYLPGPQSPGFSGAQINRSPHFAGGRLTTQIILPGSYTVEMWFWNGLPNDTRSVTGYLFSRGPGDTLSIGGADRASGKLMFADTIAGHTSIEPKTWNHAVLVRHGGNIAVYLNGNTNPEISGHATADDQSGSSRMFIGGRDDRFANFEGKIDEVAVYPRTLTPAEIAGHYQMGAQ